MKKLVLITTLLYCACCLLINNEYSVPASAASSFPAGAQQDWILTKWDADHYVLADDGSSIWVGTASGLIRWDKASGQYSRYSTADGLPHRDVRAIAVDGSGNRWFGGDGGLSRLDINEQWTTYNKANSGIAYDYVDGIALTADGSVWLSHGNSSSISQMEPDGQWVIHANKKTAVSTAYATINQTVNDSNLWAVDQDEIWIGYDVFDGLTWSRRVPPGAYGDPQQVVAGSTGTVWFLSYSAVYRWTAHGWSDYDFWAPWDGFLNSLAVGDNGQVWVGWQERYGIPYSNHSAGISPLPAEPGPIEIIDWLGVPPPAAALWLAPDGVWATGPNWLLLPGGTIKRFDDEPYFEDVNVVAVDRIGQTWIQSSYFGPYTAGNMQTLDDRGTATMNDDAGKIWQYPKPGYLKAFEPAENGDVWFAWEGNWRFRYPGGPVRLRGDSRYDYQPPSYDGYIKDIFVEDEHHAWFTFVSDTEKGVWALDDGGTVDDTADDVWHVYPLATNGAQGIVTVANKQVWYGDTSGLYIYTDPQWEQVSSEWVTDLVPARDGSLFVGLADEVLLIEPDGRRTRGSILDVISNEFGRVRQTTRRNHMWTVAYDGAVWYWGMDDQLVRKDSLGEMHVTAPFRANTIEVDKYNHLWFADGSLLRVSPQPDFGLRVVPRLWLMTAEDEKQGTIDVHAIEGYEAQVNLALTGMADGLEWFITPNPVPAGERAALHIKSSGVLPGEYDAIVSGSSGSLNHEAGFRVMIVEHVYEVYFPLLPG